MADITKLRALTSAGLMDCKKALAETDGDIQAAVEILRKKGQAVAAKREDRQAAEGCVLSKSTGKFAAIIALNCETDFVAQNAGFVALTQNLLEHSAVDLRVIHDQYFLFWFHQNRSTLLYFRPQGLPFPTGPQKSCCNSFALCSSFSFHSYLLFADHPAFCHAPIISSNQFISSTERCSNLVWGFQSG